MVAYIKPGERCPSQVPVPLDDTPSVKHAYPRCEQYETTRRILSQRWEYLFCGAWLLPTSYQAMLTIYCEIKVEGTMFRLHRHFFERESDYFRDKLNPSTEGEPDGSPDSPYIIHDVKIDEFAQFVWVWYNP